MSDAPEVPEMPGIPAEIDPEKGRWFTLEEFQHDLMEQAMVAVIKFWSEIQQVPEEAWREFGRRFILEMIQSSGDAAGVIRGIRFADQALGSKTDLGWMFPEPEAAAQPADPRPAGRKVQ